MASANEIPVQFSCQGESLFGILHTAHDDANTDVGVLFIVGGAQTRIGSHRQFVLLARQIAAQQIPVLRFDYRGMGDSEGETRSFDCIHQDIQAALDCFLLHCPKIKRFVLWGLCDGASAAMLYAYRDARVAGICLINPWVHSEADRARALLKHYYRRRLLTMDFWRQCIRLRVRPLRSIHALYVQLKILFAHRVSDFFKLNKIPYPSNALALSEKIYQASSQFLGKTLIIICDADLTAKEFEELLHSSKKWLRLKEKISPRIHHLAEANHTFTRKIWREQIGVWTVEWIQSALIMPLHEDQ